MSVSTTITSSSFLARSTVFVFIRNEDGSYSQVMAADGVTPLSGVVNALGRLMVPVPYANGEQFALRGLDHNNRPFEQPYTIADRTPPDPPTDLVITGQGPSFPYNSLITGKAQPLSTVEVWDKDGVKVGEGTADENGDFSFELSDQFINLEVLNVTAKDLGGTSSPTPVTAPDQIPPDIAGFIINQYNGVEGYVRTEPGARVEIKDENGQIVGTGVADANGDLQIQFWRPFTAGEELSAVAYDAAGNVSMPAYAFAPNFPICFAAGSFIETAEGERLVESLKAGDLIMTKDRGLQPLRWIGRKLLSQEQLAQKPQLRPIRIKAGAFGPDVPSKDLLLSPQHRVLISSRIAKRMFDSHEVLVAAKHLVGLSGVEVVNDAEGVEYIHLLMDQHEIVTSNGLESETLYTGATAINSLTQEAREEVFALFPELRNHDYRPLPVRPLSKRHQAVTLIQRHQRNAVLLCG